MFVHLASFSALRAVIINSCRSQEPKQSHQKVRLRCQIATATRELSRQVSKQRQPVTLKSSLVYLPVNQGMKLVKFSNLIINNELIICIQFPPPILFSCKCKYIYIEFLKLDSLEIHLTLLQDYLGTFLELLQKFSLGKKMLASTSTADQQYGYNLR